MTPQRISTIATAIGMAILLTVILVFTYGLIVGSRIDDETGQLLPAPTVTPLETPLPLRPPDPTLTPRDGLGNPLPGSDGSVVPTGSTPAPLNPTATFPTIDPFSTVTSGTVLPVAPVAPFATATVGAADPNQPTVTLTVPPPPPPPSQSSPTPETAPSPSPAQGYPAPTQATGYP